ncbi:uncharacterized protein TRIVIDRAFT_140997 [Trichoderma virens Gv29-8]|uniref:DUF7492 domain-containing protein n=1 Tax=Hypocrea virens (strain Gv29-8 / FGSC 10586) TaxID=413071 RepID=G9MDV5_HYPVG|nr:uncharacterized protein TRIVIDRAFT_140997 [Trichoderma virens Gv29-8]EHK26803.1 hypothetical protein TRIVIDRAFT_140997 [Trichoderma virens Gv29-8]
MYLCLYFLVATALAHSWVERLMVIDTSGKMTGQPGYIRGTVTRLDPLFNDFQMQHLLPATNENEVSESDRMCKNSQTFGNYSTTLPALWAKPGSYIALQHQENGHVTLPENSPQKESSGMIYIYGTSNPSEDDTLRSIHRVWDCNGRGGDGRGRLLAVRPFDDGQCYQINNGNISRSRQAAYPKKKLLIHQRLLYHLL